MNFTRILSLAALIFPAFALGQASGDSISIAVVPKGANKAFWQAIHAGAMKAKEELREEGLRVDVLWKGNSGATSIEKQIQIVDTFTGQRLSGILVASVDEKMLKGSVQIDSSSNLPMVYIDAALNPNQAISYVATDNFQGGVLAADRIAQLVEGEGNVIVLRDEMGYTNAEAREAGFIERIKTSHPSMRMLSIDRHAGKAYSAAYESCEYLLNRYGRRVNAIFASSALGTRAMLDALRDFKLSGQVFLVGYDASDEALQAVRDGELQGVVVSNPFRMGYLGVTTLVDHIQGRNIPTVVDTGVTLVTQANIDSEPISEILNPPVAE